MVQKLADNLSERAKRRIRQLLSNYLDEVSASIGCATTIRGHQHLTQIVRTGRSSSWELTAESETAS